MKKKTKYLIGAIIGGLAFFGMLFVIALFTIKKGQLQDAVDILELLGLLALAFIPAVVTGVCIGNYIIADWWGVGK